MRSSPSSSATLSGAGSCSASSAGSPNRCARSCSTTTSGSQGTAIRGLQAGELELETRILTVCDVYDALVSPRVYRRAWTHEQALGLLREDTAPAFDQRCVTALERVLAREHAAGLALAV
jgi:HD domain-containing protein